MSTADSDVGALRLRDEAVAAIGGEDGPYLRFASRGDRATWKEAPPWGDAMSARTMAAWDTFGVGVIVAAENEGGGYDLAKSFRSVAGGLAI